MSKKIGTFLGNKFNAVGNYINAIRKPFSYKVLLGGGGFLAGVALASHYLRGSQQSAVEQSLTLAGQQLQASQMQAAMQMEHAAAGGGIPHHASPYIMGASAQHMGMMDASPEMARG